jgi:probable F420-dependent oxidoreductase
VQRCDITLTAMRWSLALPTDRVDRAEEFLTAGAVAEAARAAEAAGFDAVYVTDHPAPDRRWLDGGGHHALEPTVALAFAAAATDRLLLQTNVYVAAYRNPFLAAKAISSLDVLSGGRVVLGVAAGYLRPEFGALGVDFDERNELLDEAIDTMRRVWAEEEVAAEGRHFRARAVSMLPRPVAPSGPPIWVGGNSTAAIRRAVARGQGWVPFPNPPAARDAVKSPSIADHAALAARLELLHAEVARTGRTEPLDVCFAPFAPPTATLRAGDGTRLADEAAAAADLGVTWMTVGLDGADSMSEWRALVDALASDVVGSGS